MPPRRSSRAASAKPPSGAKTKEQPAPRSRNQASSNKRAHSPERAASPPLKRSRTEPSKSENVPPAAPPPSRKSRSKSVTTKPQSQTKKLPKKLSPVPEARPAPPPQLKPYFNPLPVPPQKQRPGAVLFAWGAGNFGQFGMGPDILHELSKPKRNVWVEEKIEDGAFGEDGAGLESIAAGGLHSVLVDEKGTVGTFTLLVFSTSLILCRSGHAVLTTMLPLVVLHKMFPILIIPGLS
jgi:regulator of chromosome condensation